MVQVARFDKGIEVAQSCPCPKLAGAFESPLSLGAGRFDGPASDWPTAPGKLLVVYPAAVACKIVLLPTNDFSGGPVWNLQLRNAFKNRLLLAMSEVMTLLTHPLLPLGLILRI